MVRTPALRCPELDERLGAEVWLKAEGLQLSGSFKVRGATNRILQLADEDREAGVIAVSSGNHAQAVALAASRAGIEATILMPEDVPANKLDATVRLGAKVELRPLRRRP